MLFAVLLLGVSMSASAQTTAREWVDGLNATLGERFSLEVEVTMPSQMAVDDSYIGVVMVDKDGYYLNLGVMEVFSDGKLRYEVNNERKEVTEDRVNLESRDLLTNPMRAFKFLDEEFALTLGKNIEGVQIVLLQPRSETLGVGYMALLLVNRADRVVPIGLIYDFDGDLVRIDLQLYDDDRPMPRWDKSAYRAYDIVSFL